MKKIFTLIVMALMAVGVNAQQIEDITSRFASGYTWNDKESFTANADGSITFNAVSWGGLATWYGGEDLSEYSKIVFEYAEPTTVNTQILVDKVSAWGNVGITELECSFEGQNVTAVQQIALQASEATTIVIKRVYLVKAGTTPVVTYDTDALWEGECAFGNWENGFSVEAAKFADAAEGDIIEFTFTTDATTATWWQFKTVFADTENTLTSNADELNDWGCASVDKSATSYKITLNAEDVAQLKEKGLFVNGYYCVVTKAVLLKAITWTVAGTIAGSSWAEANTDFDMVSTDGVNFTLVKEDVTLEKGVNYEFKVVKNHAWDEAYPSSNYTFTVEETAKYTVTITFNAETKEITVNTEKTGEAGEVEHVWTVIGTLVGNWDVDTEMTKGDDGIYTATFTDVAAGKYEFKVRADGGWNIAYPGSNYELNVEADGSTVVVTFNPADNTVTATATVTDGITAVKAGQQNAQRYNLAGQKVGADFKGIVIENGKKIVVK